MTRMKKDVLFWGSLLIVSCLFLLKRKLEEQNDDAPKISSSNQAPFEYEIIDNSVECSDTATVIFEDNELQFQLIEHPWHYHALWETELAPEIPSLLSIEPPKRSHMFIFKNLFIGSEDYRKIENTVQDKYWILEFKN